METREGLSSARRAESSTLEELQTELGRVGYAPSTITLYLRACRGFYSWRAMSRPGFACVDDETIKAFLSGHLVNCKCHPRCPSFHTSRAGLVHLQRMLAQKQREKHGEEARVLTPVETELCAFDDYMSQVCGLSTATRLSRRRYVSEFLSSQFAGCCPIRPRQIVPHRLVEYVSERTRGLKPGTAGVIATALRGYLKYLQFHGDVEPALRCVIPSAPHPRLADYPVVLSDSQITAFENAFDLSGPSGMRDHAMALSMLHMGLRCIEVASLALTDVDWREGRVFLSRGKGGRVRELPLPYSCGSAIARYLRHGRPMSRDRAVFLRHTVPVGLSLNTEQVRGAMRRAYQRAGFPASFTGTHILRHTCATRMLANGAGIKSLADVLGHQSIDTTMIYTKVDFVALGRVVTSWPEVRR